MDILSCCTGHRLAGTLCSLLVSPVAFGVLPYLRGHQAVYHICKEDENKCNENSKQDPEAQQSRLLQLLQAGQLRKEQPQTIPASPLLREGLITNPQKVGRTSLSFPLVPRRSREPLKFLPFPHPSFQAKLMLLSYFLPDSP